MKYECHVTYDYPHTVAEYSRLQEIGIARGWSPSAIDGDPILGKKKFFYFTCHSDSVTELHSMILDLQIALLDTESPIRRAKIEETVYDKRY